MNKELKGFIRRAKKGLTIHDDVWEAYIDLPKHGGLIAVYRTSKDEAVKIRQIILDALHAYGKEEDPEAWREENLKKQAAGVRFEFLPSYSTRWERGDSWSFLESKERYREVPQQPHAAERALWKAQREAGTNEVWQAGLNGEWISFPVDMEPGWDPDFVYRPKPKPAKLTAKIAREDRWGTVRQQDWEFYGTPEGYRVECEKYGYAVVSEIKKVVKKPKTFKCYTAMFTTPDGKPTVVWDKHKSSLLERVRKYKYTLVGEVEEWEVEV